jgi:hypothetical protein
MQTGDQGKNFIIDLIQQNQELEKRNMNQNNDLQVE